MDRRGSKSHARVLRPVLLIFRNGGGDGVFSGLCDSLIPDPGLSDGLLLLLLLLLWVFGSQRSSLLLLAQKQAPRVWVLAVVKRHMVDTLDVRL